MTCLDISKPIAEYLDGRLGFVKRLQLRAHLRNCPACRHYFNQMRATIRSLKRLPPESPPSRVLADLRERFRSWKRADPRR